MTGEPLRKTPDQKGPVLQMVEFEDVQIQWNRGQWNFNNPEQGSVLIDTYSVWNREHWGEIADRLLSGQTCALYMMGNFGVARVYDLQDTKSEDVILDDIKRRERINNLVGFAPPEDIGGLIDFERLPERFADLQDAEKRRALYPGPMHAVFPLKDPDSANSSIVRQDDKTIAIFWIPGHWGYEGLSQQMKIRGAKGILGGGSLNLHGAEPSYTAQALHEQMERIPEWQTNIDFILFDELAEAAGIGRSHTQVSFVVDPPKVIRIGSMTPRKITRDTGIEIVIEEGTRTASSLTEYTDEIDSQTDQKVEAVLSQMQRFGEWYTSKSPTGFAVHR